jgi:hypothetical protein
MYPALQVECRLEETLCETSFDDISKVKHVYFFIVQEEDLTSRRSNLKSFGCYILSVTKHTYRSSHVFLGHSERVQEKYIKPRKLSL